MNDVNTMPATAEDFLDLARQVLVDIAVPTKREIAVAQAYTDAARAIAKDGSTLPDLRCAHLRLCDALDDQAPDQWEAQLGGAHVWLTIAETTIDNRRRAARAAEQAETHNTVYDLGYAVDIDIVVP